MKLIRLKQSKEKINNLRKIDTEILIVGAGISGISLAGWLNIKAPNRKYMILEARENIGGTWDLFRYPGIRSDSEMFTLGFAFKPWRDDDAIASGEKIMAYLNETIDEFDIRKNIRFNHKVQSANWNSKEQVWEAKVQLENGDIKIIRARFLYMGTGYYDYENPYNPQINGEKDFKGDIFHAQFWPKSLDYTNKNIVVIGSGATALTIIPTMAKGAKRVTMLQRSPSYVFIRPKKDWFSNIMKAILPPKLAYDVSRFKFTFISGIMNKHIRKHPDNARKRMMEMMQKALPNGFDMRHFTPNYNVWDQRVCAAPDGDFFDAVKGGNLDVITSNIRAIKENHIEIENGNKIAADIIVKATGLNLIAGPKFDLLVDNKPIEIANCVIYKGCMFSNIPNFAFVFGYLMASWTLKADLVAQYFIRFIDEIDKKDAKSATPILDISKLNIVPMFDFSSGYIVRSINKLPKQSDTFPWQINQDYGSDKKILLKMPIADENLNFN